MLEVATRRAASGGPEPDSGSSLIWWALRANPTAWLGLTVGVAGLLLGPGRNRALAGWDQLERGEALRSSPMPLVMLSVWYHTLYSYNYFLNEWHHLDRLAIIGLGIAVWWRPIFLVPLVLVARVIDAQFLVPFGSSPGVNIGQLLLMCLLVVAAGLIGFAIHGDHRTSGVVLVISAVVASHFFEPGRSKISLGWATNSDLSEFAHASYTAGCARVRRRHLVGLDRVDRRDAQRPDHRRDDPPRSRSPHRRGQLSLVALVAGGLDPPPRGNSAVSGFWLFEWVLVELLLLILLFRRDLRDTLRENDTPARALLAVGLVAIGGVLFHPPKLAWLDAPVSYGYEIEAVGASGRRYNVVRRRWRRPDPEGNPPAESDVLPEWLELGDGPKYDGDEQLISVEVIRVRSIHDPEQRFEHESVLTVEWVDGAARVVQHDDPAEE